MNELSELELEAVASGKQTTTTVSASRPSYRR